MWDYCEDKSGVIGHWEIMWVHCTKQPGAENCLHLLTFAHTARDKQISHSANQSALKTWPNNDNITWATVNFMSQQAHFIIGQKSATLQHVLKNSNNDFGRFINTLFIHCAKCHTLNHLFDINLGKNKEIYVTKILVLFTTYNFDFSLWITWWFLYFTGITKQI